MKPFELSKESYHWRLATVYGPLSDSEYLDSDYQGNYTGRQTNICNYVVAVAVGVGACLIWAFFGALILGFPAGSTLGWLAAMVGTHGWISPESSALALPVFVLFIACLMAMAWAVDRYKQYKIDRCFHTSGQDPTLLDLWYRSFKDKTCVRLVIK